MRSHHAKVVLRQWAGHLALHKPMPKQNRNRQAPTATRLHPGRAYPLPCGDKSVMLGPGGLLQIQPDVMHWGKVVGDERVSISMFSPQCERNMRQRRASHVQP